jgi:citrate lyase beta subunit
MAQSNREVLLACMIEDMEAVEQIEEIAAVDGVDLLAVDPSDLSRSLGVSGHPDHPKLIAAIDRVHAPVRNGAASVSRSRSTTAPFRLTPPSSRNSASAIRIAPRRQRRGCSSRSLTRRRNNGSCWVSGTFNV